MKRKLAVVFALTIGCPIFAQAENPVNPEPAQPIRARMADVKDQSGFQKMVDLSSEAYGALSKGPHGEVPPSVLKNAKCIAILPNLLTGAVIVGGTHGNGVASCKNSENKWSQPAPISLNQGSIGLQAGGKSADLVLFIQSKQAVQALKNGNFAIGTDISAVAGTFDTSVDTSSAGVIAFNRAEGVFAGASVSGSKIGKDLETLTGYYGKDCSFTALLEGRESPDSSGYTDKLTKMFP